MECSTSPKSFFNYLGTWIVLLVLFIYGPMLITRMSDPSTVVKVERIHYFADTLLFCRSDSLARQREAPRFKLTSDNLLQHLL